MPEVKIPLGHVAFHEQPKAPDQVVEPRRKDEKILPIGHLVQVGDTAK